MKKKILVRACFYSTSGYGVHSRFVLRALKHYEHLFDIYVIPINWGKTGWNLRDTEETRWFDMLTQKTIHYIQNGGQFDVSLQVTIPNEYECMAPINIGVTAGVESSKISPQWMQKCNEVVDRVITTSRHASYGFLNTRYYSQDPTTGKKVAHKVEKPIVHVTYPVDMSLCVRNDDRSNFEFSTDFNFLTIAQWSPRKHLENTVRWWIDEFREDENVGLIVKTSIANGSRIDREYTNERFDSLLKECGERKCKVYLIHGDLVESELCQLYQHESVKCLVALGNEGFNLPAFEATTNDLPILAVDWSGHLDFLYKQIEGEVPKSLFTPVQYDIINVQPEAVWDGVIQKDSHWAFPKQADYKVKLRDVFDNWQEKKEMAVELGSWVREEFEATKQYRRFVEALDLGFNLDVGEPAVLEFD